MNEQTAFFVPCLETAALPDRDQRIDRRQSSEVVVTMKAKPRRCTRPL